MKKALAIICKAYSTIGVVWLTFSILSVGIFHRSEKQKIEGEVKQIIETNWNGYSSIDAIIETNDGLGNIIATIYKPGVNEGDKVVVDATTGRSSSSYIHASVMRE